MKSGSDPSALNFKSSTLSFKGLIGTGGIGSGKFFQLTGTHTLGREESRGGRLLDVKDYCKQHIILYYVKILLGPEFPVTPIGKLGDDENGRALFREMEETGFVMKLVRKVPDLPTLFSFCFQYPDGSGGNLTEENSASAHVDTDFIKQASGQIKNLGITGIILAAPEVPLSARQTLLEIGKQHGLFCTASFTTGEIRDAMDMGMISNVDLIALNIDEAAAISGTQHSGTDPGSFAKTAVRALRSHKEDILVSITAGNKGSWCWDGQELNRFPAIETVAVNTAGAGDAFFSGLLCGIALGLHFFEAQQLATLIAGMSVTSKHTIHHGIHRKSMHNYMLDSGLVFPEKVIELLQDY